MKKITAILLSMVFAVLIFVPAAGMSQSAWDNYYNYDEDALKGVIMQPGRDESERNFSWLIPSGSSDFYVAVSTAPNMANAVKFRGTSKTVGSSRAAKVTVTGLSLSTNYYYTVNDSSGASSVYSFRTAGRNAFTAMYVTDIHIGNDKLSSHALKFENVTEDAKARAGGHLDLILSAGDQTSHGDLDEYIALTAGKTVRGITFATTVGNHDADSGSVYTSFVNTPHADAPSVTTHKVKDYWFVKGSALFIVLDSNDADGPGHDAVLREAIEQNPTAKWRIVMMHHDLYSKVMSDREREAARLRPLLVPLFDQYDIDLALLGHTHYFSVSNVMYDDVTRQRVTPNCTLEHPVGTVYLVSGSINKPRRDENPSYGEDIGVGVDENGSVVYNLIDFTSDTLTVRAVDYDDDRVFNTLTLKKNPAGRQGDIDRDGFITAADARLALRCAVELEAFKPGTAQFVGADYDCDGAVTAADARQILRFSVHLYPGEPK